MKLLLIAAAAALPLVAHADLDMQTCVLLMQFEDEPGLLADSTRNQPEATSEGAISPAEGRFGGGCALGPGGGWLDCGTNFGLSFCVPEQTISLWLKPAAEALGSGERRFIVGSREAPERSSWRWNLVVQEDGLLGFRLYDGQLDDPAAILTAPDPLRGDRWTHVAVVIDTVGEDVMRLFVDGEQADEHELISNSPYGSLYIGGAPPQGFVGAVDEVALFEAALPAEDIRALAAADEPLEAMVAMQEELPDGFRIRPMPGMHYVVVAHSAVPATRWMLRIPEHTWLDGEKRVVSTDVIWERGDEAQTWRFTWGVDEDEKRRALLDFEGAIAARGDVIEYSLTARNVGDERWDRTRMALFCFKAPESPEFVDYEAERTWVRRGGQWVSMGEVVNHEFAEHRMCGIGVGDADGQAEPIAAKVSQDGRFVTAIATDPAGSLSFNFQTSTNCMHSNPRWELLEPGQEQTVTGRIYFVEGTLDDAYERYREDFGIH